MKFTIKKIYIILFILSILTFHTKGFAKNNNIQYSRENISSYFSGIISLDQNQNNNAYKHLKKVQSLKKKHSNFNIQFIKTLVLLERFDQAFSFLKSLEEKNKLFFEANLLLGLDSFMRNDYANAEKHFERLNKISGQSFFFQDFIGNILLAWTKAAENNKKDSFKFLKKIPNQYYHIVKIQNSFLQCYFETNETSKYFKELINDEDYNFSRYNFFLINYFLSKNKISDAKEVIYSSSEKYSSNLLLNQTRFFFLNNEKEKIKNFYNCKYPKHSIAEFFYILANLYSSEKNYQLSNFYLKISLFLNSNFSTNNTLLAENLYYQKKDRESKKIYFSIKSIGSLYSWHSSKNIAAILLREKGKKYSVRSLENDFNLLKNPNFNHYYEFANFYKDHEYFEQSIKYYSIALDKIEKDHFLIPKILERRGTSYERLGDWKSAEKDLIDSLKISPDQAYVLNYLAYTWIDKGMNLDKGLEMLKKATRLRDNDGYIIDSLGWAYYIKKNYREAKIFLQRAVELLPLDPVINDHYADVLWMLNKDIQARYFWNYILKLEDTKKELKDVISEKLIYGIKKKL